MVSDEFEMVAHVAKDSYSHIAVCRAAHGHESIFTIPFQSEEQLQDFLNRNHGDTAEQGFYAKGFVDGEYIGENT